MPSLSFPSNLANTPIEVIESQAPIRITRRALRHGTGGAGKTRGGDGQVFELELLADEPVTMTSWLIACGPRRRACAAVKRVRQDVCCSMANTSIPEKHGWPRRDRG